MFLTVWEHLVWWFKSASFVSPSTDARAEITQVLKRCVNKGAEGSFHVIGHDEVCGVLSEFRQLSSLLSSPHQSFTVDVAAGIHRPSLPQHVFSRQRVSVTYMPLLETAFSYWSVLPIFPFSLICEAIFLCFFFHFVHIRVVACWSWFLLG